jgi:hypothetical protein
MAEESKAESLDEEVVPEKVSSPKPKKKTARKPKNIKDMTAKVRILKPKLATSKGYLKKDDIIELPEMEVRRLAKWLERL